MITYVETILVSISNILKLPIFNIYLYFYNFYNYKNILEYVPKTNIKIKNQKILNSEFIESINNICNNINNKKLIISLSGGVDSMVLTTILHNLYFDIICIHINYNNRNETKEEEKFLTEWCKFNKIKLYIKSIDNIKRENTKRSDYELITKNLRFDFYKEIMKKEKTDCVLLGHHKDDIIENVVANICRGRNYLDLAVIRERTNINNINMIRPMISFYKSEIYNFAHLYSIPYFKNTTPYWCVRGKYRNIIGPALEDTFSKNVKENLLNISNQADDLNLLIQQEIITPLLSQILFEIYIDRVNITIDTEKYINYPIIVWNIIFINIFTRYGYKTPSKKSIQILFDNIKLQKNKNYNLSNKCKCNIEGYKIIIDFKIDNY